MKVSITITDERDVYVEGEKTRETFTRVNVYDMQGSAAVVAGFLGSIVGELQPERTTAESSRVVRGAM
jgi:hypothetical protein